MLHGQAEIDLTMLFDPFSTGGESTIRWPYSEGRILLEPLKLS